MALLSLSLAPVADAQATTNAITALSGSVQIVRGTQTLTATNGTQVLVGDRIRTGPGSGATITLSDGSTLEVGESGEITLDQQNIGPNGGANTSTSVFKGVMRSVVAHLASGPVGNFEVHTPNAVASARGTVYDVDYVQGVNRTEFK
ncbi:MAG TPA: FecR family protein, partial [Candidatus Binataceae bacterium]|nr:FecR family protein [Candidatus Binataceae bacterium]